MDRQRRLTEVGTGAEPKRMNTVEGGTEESHIPSKVSLDGKAHGMLGRQ